MGVTFAFSFNVIMLAIKGCERHVAGVKQLSIFGYELPQYVVSSPKILS